MGKPRFAPLPPRRIRLTPFPQSCHGFVLAPSSRQKPRQPRVSTNLLLWGESLHPRRAPLSLPILRPRIRLFQKAQKCRICGNPARAPLQSTADSLPAVPLDRRLRKLPLRVFAVPAPLRGMVFQASEKLLRSAALRGRIFRVLENPCPVYENSNHRKVFFPTLGKWGPRCACPQMGPPHKMGPRALRALVFPAFF